MESEVTAAAVYCRISQDRGGTMLGVERQEGLCRELAARKGWPVAEVYVDNDISAYSGKPRPAYRRMLDDIASGRIDAVLMVDTDRLTRHPRELEDFIDLAEKHSTLLANVSGDLDLSTSDGRFRARIMGAVARQESEKKSERLRRQRAQAATRGQPHPGPRAFGFEAGNVKLDSAEAALLREAAADVLAGRSLRSIADRWNAAGVRTARGNRWTVNAVRDVLTSPRTAGLRRHHGDVVGEGTWPAILDRLTWERLVAAAKTRRRGVGRPATRLLSGIAACARCGQPMRSSIGNRGEVIYACRRQPGIDAACGRTSVIAGPADDEVRDRILVRLSSGDGLARAIEGQCRDDSYRELAAQMEADEAVLEQLATDFYVDRILGRGEFLRAREVLERRIATARAGLTSNGRSSVLAGLPVDSERLRAWWDGAPGDIRRAVVSALVDCVRVAPLDPAKPRRFDPERLTVRWRV